MKHLSEVRIAVRETLLQIAGTSPVERLCAMWDLQGRLRVLIRPQDGANSEAIRRDIEAAMSTVAAPYWAKESWLWHQKVSPAERTVYEAAWGEALELTSGEGKVRELNRHISKGSWFATPHEPPWPLMERTPPIVSFFSFKGGVGRTTALASCAIQLSRAGRRVCVVDLDLEAPGAGVLIAPTRGSAHYGVVDYLLERPLHRGSDLDPGEYVHTCDDPEVIGVQGVPIAVVPAGVLDSDYLEKLARIDYERLVAPSEGEPLLVQLLREVRGLVDAEYILIDSRAGLHDIGGLALNGLAHLDIVLATDNEQSWVGLDLVTRHLGRRQIEMNRLQQVCGLVFALAPGPTTPERVDRVRAFAARSYDLFGEAYYNPEGDEHGEWPLPAVDAEDQPHYPTVLGFSEDVQKAQSLGAAAQVLTQGDFQRLYEWLLSRLGRVQP